MPSPRDREHMKQMAARSAEVRRQLADAEAEELKAELESLAPKERRERMRERKLEQLVPKALKRLEELMDSEDGRIAANAAVKVLEYKFGKPATAGAPVVPNGEPSTVFVFEGADYLLGRKT